MPRRVATVEFRQRGYSLTEPQLQWLEARAARHGISVNEELRRLVDSVRFAEQKEEAK